MYTIPEVIYGLPLTRKVSENFPSEAVEGEVEDFFCVQYDGQADYEKGWLGVTLDVKFDIFEEYRVSDLTKAKPTETQKKMVQAQIDALPQEIKDLYDSLEPDVWIVWSTS